MLSQQANVIGRCHGKRGGHNCHAGHVVLDCLSKEFLLLRNLVVGTADYYPVLNPLGRPLETFDQRRNGVFSQERDNQ